MIVRSFLIGLMAFTCLSPPASAEDRISPIRKAAMERLRDKLGTIRGSIDPNDHRVLLTERMIELRKPFRLVKPQSSIETLRPTRPRGFDTITTAALPGVGSSGIEEITAIADQVSAGH